MPTVMILLLSSSSVGVSGSQIYTGSQNLACVLSSSSPRTKRDTFQLGLNLLGVLMAPLTGGLSIPLAVALSSETWHESVAYKQVVFEWGEKGLHIGQSTRVPGCELKWTSYATSHVALAHVIAHAKQYHLQGRYNMFTNNCHHFARYLYDFLLMSWTPTENPIYFYYQKADECHFYNNHDKLDFIRYNSTYYIGWNDAATRRQEEANTTRFFLEPSRPYHCTVYIDTSTLDKSACPIDNITAYGTEEYATHALYAPDSVFHSSTLFRDRLLHYMKYTCVNSRWKRYEVGIQYGGCIVGGHPTSRAPLYYPRLMFERKIFQWDRGVDFVYGDLPRVERCPVRWDYDPVGSMARTSALTLCSLEDAVAYGLIYKFFKGSYDAQTNKGYTFVDTLARWLYDDCVYTPFPYRLNFDRGCLTRGRDVFVTFYQRFRGTKGFIFNTCYDYNIAYNEYVSWGWCTYIATALAQAFPTREM